jgi:hypothetical protein
MQNWLTRLGLGMSISLLLQAWRPEAATLWTLVGAVLMWRRVTSWMPDGSQDPTG